MSCSRLFEGLLAEQLQTRLQYGATMRGSRRKGSNPPKRMRISHKEEEETADERSIALHSPSFARAQRSERSSNHVTQHIEVVVRLVVAQWDLLAQKLGAQSAQAMVHHFIALQHVSELNQRVFVALLNRSDGWAIPSQPECSDSGFYVTTKSSEVGTLASLSEDLDSALRSLAKSFLDCLDSCVSKTDFTNHARPAIDAFLRGQGLLAKGARMGSALHALYTEYKDLFPEVDFGSVLHVCTTAGSVAQRADPPRDVSAYTSLVHAVSDFVVMEHATFGSFWRRLETVLTSNVQLVLTDPPYNSRRELASHNSDHDVLHDADMVLFAEITVRMLRCGGHAIIFCDAQQFPAWTSAFNKYSSAKEVAVDSMPLVITRHPRAFTQDPLWKSTTLTNMHEFAVHVTKLGAGLTGHRMVNYRRFNYVPSHQEGYTNSVTGVPKLKAGEGLLLDDGRLLRPEQKPLPLLQELVARFSQPGDIVVDCFAGTYSTAAACLAMRNGEYRRFFGCESDRQCHYRGSWPILLGFVLPHVAGSFPKCAKLQGSASCRLAVARVLGDSSDDEHLDGEDGESEDAERSEWRQAVRWMQSSSQRAEHVMRQRQAVPPGFPLYC